MGSQKPTLCREREAYLKEKMSIEKEIMIHERSLSNRIPNSIGSEEDDQSSFERLFQNKVN
jgi:hypothetical protein